MVQRFDLFCYGDCAQSHLILQMANMKFLYPFLAFLFGGLTGEGQTPEQIALRIANDTAISIWDHKVDPKVYYHLGKILAQRDINKDIFLIQTYGNPDFDKPCSICAYEKYGFRLQYHWDIVYDEKTNFIEGYNEISETYLKSKIGDSAFSKLEVLPAHFFDPATIINKFNSSKQRQRFYDIEILSDTAIRVKLKVDSIFKNYPALVKKIGYGIHGYMPKVEKNDSLQVLTYHQMKHAGFVVYKNARGNYSYSITYDFTQLPIEKLFCGCTFTKNIYSYIEQLKLAR
jgi:hypothetical protein